MSPPTGPRGAKHVLGTAAAVVGVYLSACLIWLVIAPRQELVSAGDGTAFGFPEGSSVGAAQLLVLVVVVFSAAVAATLVLWRRHPGLRTPAGAAILLCWGGVGTALAASVLGPASAWLLGPDRGTPAGTLLSLAPAVGPLFRGPVLGGVVGPDWSVLPAAIGWAAPGAVAATLTTAFAAWLSPWEELVAPGDGAAPLSASPEA